MTNKEKFIEVFGEELQRQYITKSWWEEVEAFNKYWEKCSDDDKRDN